LLPRLLLVALVLAAYANSFSTGFPLDNKALILQDTRVHEATRANVDLILDHTYWWPIGESGLYRPVTTLSYLVNYAVLGNADRPVGYHVVNLTLHIVNVLLVYALLLRVGGPAEAGRPDRSNSSSYVASGSSYGASGFSRTLAIAAIWAVHPLSTEAVTNIVGRADLIAALAVLGGLLIYIRALEAAGSRRIAWLAALAAITALGAFAKESAVVIVGVIGLYVVTVQKSPLILSLSKDERPKRGKRARPSAFAEATADRRSAKRGGWSTGSGRASIGLAAAAIALAIPLLFYWSQRSAVLGAAPFAEFPFVDNPIAGAGFWSGRLTAIAVIARYLWLIVWPVQLSADYSYAQIPLSSGRLWDWVSWALVAAIAAACVLLWRRDRKTFFFAGFALLTFLPASNLLFPTGTIMAERIMYLPSLGVIALLVAYVGSGFSRTYRPLVLAIVVIALGVRTWIRNTDWQNDRSLWTATVQTSPRSFKAQRGLAEALYEADPSHANMDRVVAEIEQAMAPLESLEPDRNDAKTYRMAGGYYLEYGDSLRPTADPPPAAVNAYERAVSALRRALTIIESHRSGGTVPAADVYRVLSAAHGRLRQHGPAIDAATQARALDPFNVIGYQQSAAAFLSAQRGDEAAVVLMTGVMVTEDRALRDELVDLYRQGLDPLGCALVNTRDGAAINPSCATVRRHVCAATGEAVRIDMNAGRSAQAQRLRDSAVRQFQCS
jgi:hypothetical protein